MRRGVKTVAATLGLPVLLFATWWFASDGSDSLFWPPLREILGTLPSTWFGDRLQDDVLPSLLRLTVGYFTALGIGVGAGLVIGLSSPLRQYCEPVFEFLRSIPPPVVIPIAMLFTGIGDIMKIIVIAFGCVWPILINTVEGVRSVDEVLADTARVYRFGARSRFQHLVLRSASPQIMTGARQALSLAIILMVISEMFAAHNGLGFVIVQFQRSFAIPEMWSGILLLGVIGVLLSLLFQFVESRVLAWYFAQRRTQ